MIYRERLQFDWFSTIMLGNETGSILGTKRELNRLKMFRYLIEQVHTAGLRGVRARARPGSWPAGFTGGPLLLITKRELEEHLHSFYLGKLLTTFLIFYTSCAACLPALFTFSLSFFFTFSVSCTWILIITNAHKSCIIITIFLKK